MSKITTHVLDTVLGKPADGIAVRLEKREGGGWIQISSGATDSDGRCPNLALAAESGIYKITFATGEYLQRMGRRSIYYEITITFICGGEVHYHLPLLLSDNSYTTYRGS